MSDDPVNPFGGLLFAGPEDALAHLADAAEKAGLRLVAIDLGDDTFRLCLPAEHSFGALAMALVNRTQDGEFGEISLGLFAGTVQRPN